MRVLQICSGNLYGGVETTMLTLARSRCGSPRMEFDFTVCFEGRFSEELRSCGAQVLNVGAVRIRNPVSIFRSRKRLRGVLSASAYDAVICHSAWSHSIFGPVVREVQVPLLFWLHGAPSGSHWLERWAGKTHPDTVICCSEFTAGLAWKLFPGIHKEVVYPPLTPALQNRTAASRSEVRAELKTPSDAVVIVQVSRMEQGKGQLSLLEALTHLSELPNWVCWFVGGPQRSSEASYMRQLQADANQSGIASRIRFAGHRSDVPRLMQAADVFCQPNTTPEGFGQVFVEAFVSGIPVVTSAIGGGLEVLDSTCGVLTPPKDVAALAAALNRLLADANLRKTMGEAALVRARKLCEPSRQASRLVNVIENTVFRERTA